MKDSAMRRRINFGQSINNVYRDIIGWRLVIDGSITFWILGIDFPFELGESDAHPSELSQQIHRKPDE